jgi:hypothetical protein
MGSGGLPADDLLLASAARFLIDGGDNEAANVLLFCELQIEAVYWAEQYDDKQHVSLKLTGPRAAYQILKDVQHPITDAILSAILAVIPLDVYLGKLTAKAELIEIDPEWRTELREVARGRGILNQVALAETPIRTWNNLKFRSQGEVRIAEALDRAAVLFLPNCSVRLGLVGTRRNREPDFLICHEGRWGVLQVDGEPFHPPARTVHEHEQDRLFHNHGIVLVQHYDATRCYEHSDEVVNEFLGLLRKL